MQIYEVLQVEMGHPESLDYPQTAPRRAQVAIPSQEKRPPKVPTLPPPPSAPPMEEEGTPEVPARRKSSETAPAPPTREGRKPLPQQPYEVPQVRKGHEICSHYTYL